MTARHRRRNMPAREQAALPPERVAEVGFVWWPDAGRIIAPWARTSEAIHDPLNQQRLLCVLDYVRAVRPTQPCWLWPERAKPAPIEADPRWFDRWASERACYLAGR